jgi:HK97 family phage prohead protease
MKTKHYVAPLQIKTMDDNGGTFIGYGAVFGNKDSYGDVILKGAFKSHFITNAPASVKMLWQHDSREPIGVYEDIKEDENGLLVKGKLLINDVDRAREAYALLKAGAISGLSIGYSVNNEGSYMGKDGNHYLKDLSLWEISIVTFPANDQANVESVKSVNDIDNIRDFEKCLRDVGFSQQKAKAIAAEGFKAISLNETLKSSRPRHY